MSGGVWPQAPVPGQLAPGYNVLVCGQIGCFISPGREELSSFPSGEFLRESLSGEEGRGGPLVFAWIDHFCLALLTQTASPPTHAQT